MLLNYLLPKFHVTDEETALIDDRDIDSIIAMKGMVFSPANSSEEVITHVLNRFYKNRDGYVSRLQHVYAEKEIINIIYEKNRLVKKGK